MSNFDNPYDEDDLEPVNPRGEKRRAARDAMAPEAPIEGDDIDRVCAFQPMNDFGNAQRLILRFGDNLMYVENIGWFIWDSARWDRERGMAEAVKRGFRVSQGIIAEAKALREGSGRVSPERINRLFSWSVQSGTPLVHLRLFWNL